MTQRRVGQPDHERLPSSFRDYFWDYRFSDLSWRSDQELITARLLSAGSWPALGWLRQRLGDGGLRAWICRRRGAGLSARQLRFWALVLDLPRRQVNRWLNAPGRTIWDRRGQA
jgi:hypothetical protein